MELIKPAWRKSKYSGAGNNCVEAARLDEGVGLRDSKHPEGGHLTLAPEGFRALLDRLKS
ncbi:DUF397 domain-containing protein [Actinomadura fibrosa]|uniref:DUF397 domain-containing protein n=1 Tax=Actinomadura fibrosa TaxID=111802 RepID=A0ABW2XCC9_9ACTN|nr:DUF397 domain-containing protein [Actinomadura fibrosa]